MMSQQVGYIPAISKHQKTIYGAFLLKTKGETQFEINKNVNGAWTLPSGQLVRNQKRFKAVLAKASQIIIDQPIGKSRKPEYGFASPMYTN